MQISQKSTYNLAGEKRSRRNTKEHISVFPRDVSRRLSFSHTQLSGASEAGAEEQEEIFNVCNADDRVLEQIHWPADIKMRSSIQGSMA